MLERKLDSRDIEFAPTDNNRVLEKPPVRLLNTAAGLERQDLEAPSKGKEGLILGNLWRMRG